MASNLSMKEPGQLPSSTTAHREGARKDNQLFELSREECLELLASHRFGRLAAVMGAGPPVIRPVNYVFDRASQSVVFRTARGSKLHALAHAATAAFEIDGTDEEARTGWSVIVRGVTSEIASANDIDHLEGLRLDPWAPGRRPVWVRIRVGTLSGRRIAPAAEGPTG